jgi:hypothetical protein
MRILLLLLACSSPPVREPDEYTGCGKDENWITFDDQEHNVKIDDTQAPQVTAPMAGSFSDKQIFTWNLDVNEPGTPDGDVQYMCAPTDHCCDQWNIGALTTLHLKAISGDVYDLKLWVGGTIVHRVVTTLQEWTPTDAVWQSWRGQQVTLTLTRMSVLRDDVKEGPFRASKGFVSSVD